MKRLVCLVFISVLALVLISCGESISAPTSDATITLTDLNGEKADIDVNEDIDVSSYRIIRSDTERDAVKNAATEIRMAVLEKTGIKLDLVTDWNASGSSSKEIVVGVTKDANSSSLSEGLGYYDFKIAEKNGKIYILGGSDEALGEAAALFVKCFIYGENKSILVPADEGYTFLKSFIFDKLTIDGVDISEFSVYCTDKVTVDHSNIKTHKMAEELSLLMKEKLVGIDIPVAEEMGDGHYIVLTASNIDPDGYSVKIENGNVYIDGSFTTVNNAYDAFLTEILGYTEDRAHSGDTLSIDAKNNIEGSLNYTVPYTKQDLLDLFAEAYENDEMVISGTHAYKGFKGKSWVASTVDAVYEASGGQSPAIIEVDIGRHSVYYDFYSKGDTISPYDLSANVAECAEHVSNGGIVSVCIHMANPLNNAEDKVWYRGHLDSEAMAKDMLTDGTEMNKALRKTLESTFMLIKALDDNGIPFMFRPLHEMNGGWFWWCVGQGGFNLSQETMADFWKFFYKVVTEEMGIEDAIWVYAPNYNSGSIADVLYAYPGDEYVDIVGCDWYTNGNYEINNKDSYTKVMSTGKPAALTEVGPVSGGGLAATDAEGNTYYLWTNEDLLASIKRMAKDGMKVSYFLTWTNKLSIAELGMADVLMYDDIVVSREDLMERWNSEK
ncbi:MAG: hypothetical protein IKJ91_09570 [Clostridia bacterium]|nr:hypothetical protein [Clostridia bacterium]